MASAIDTAWIGLAGVAVGSFFLMVGTVLNGRIARNSAAMTIEAEHRQRLWEKQTAAYEDTVREVLARQIRREALTSQGDVGNIGRHPVEELRKHEDPESVRIKALMLAYASAPVWGAYEESDKANTRFWANLARLASAQIMTQRRAEQESAGTPEGSPLPVVDYQAALDAMHKSKEDAVVADKALFAAINSEPCWRPSTPPRSEPVR